MSIFDILHAFVNVFASGRSSIKLDLFLLLCALLIGFHYSRYGILKLSFFRKIVSKNNSVRIFFISFLAVGYVWGVTITLLLYQALQVNLSKTLVILSSGSISTTQLLHTHVLKAPIGHLLIFLGLGNPSGDLGISYIQYLSKITLYLSDFILLLVLLSTSIFLFIIWISEKRKVIKFLLTLLIFSLVKNIFDGGFLNYEVVPAFVAFLVLLYEYNKIRFVIISFTCLPFLIGFFAYTISLLDIQGLAKYYQHSYSLLILYITIISFIDYSILQKRIRFLLVVCSLVGTIYPTLFYLYNDFKYSDMSIESNKTRFATYTSNKNTDLVLLESFSDRLKLYRLASSSQYHNVGDIIDSFSENISYLPVSIEYKTCIPNRSIVRTFDVILDKPIAFSNLIESEYIKIKDLNLVDINRGRYVYEIDVHFDSCLPRQLNFLQELFIINGYHNSILLIKFAESKN